MKWHIEAVLVIGARCFIVKLFTFESKTYDKKQQTSIRLLRSSYYKVRDFKLSDGQASSKILRLSRGKPYFFLQYHNLALF